MKKKYISPKITSVRMEAIVVATLSGAKVDKQIQQEQGGTVSNNLFLQQPMKQDNGEESWDID